MRTSLFAITFACSKQYSRTHTRTKTRPHLLPLRLIGSSPGSSSMSLHHSALASRSLPPRCVSARAIRLLLALRDHLADYAGIPQSADDPILSGKKVRCAPLAVKKAGRGGGGRGRGYPAHIKPRNRKSGAPASLQPREGGGGHSAWRSWNAKSEWGAGGRVRLGGEAAQFHAISPVPPGPLCRIARSAYRRCSRAL